MYSNNVLTLNYWLKKLIIHNTSFLNKQKKRPEGFVVKIASFANKR